ncbi:ParB/RepB/Spo0J family partition protein [Falsirhodobacter algicola]|uniref:ParB N-terminal domain-containing protein n=1 Tax=Falsirhodobacter algicola TaxID=2692330 RepID=A0A8J8MWB0_9RHOB|nr:ParB N-terminal domain-containing protein [Falsirhodobacter algicola]QUS37323.1 ParB N-terminal domain-containing protein [Falsirhodobacter algicola]
MIKRRTFDIDFPGDAPVPAGTDSPERETRRGPMAAAISENAEALRERQATEAAIRAENDRLAHELVRLKKLGLVTDLIPLDAIRATKLTRDRAEGRDPELDELKESIRAVGLSNPIRVEADGQGGYQLVQGFRRLEAFRELYGETGEERFAAIPAGMIAPGETLESLYRRMVDENLVRRDISFAEMAILARSYLLDPDTAATSIDQAIATLFQSAGRQKRVYIRNFTTLLDRVGMHLLHPHAIPRALGLDVLKRVEREPGAATMLGRLLMTQPERTESDEVMILRDFAAGAGQPAPVRPARGPGNPGAKTTIRVARGDDVARCTATHGRVELRMDRDFSAIDRHRLEQALEAFLTRLDDPNG